MGSNLLLPEINYKVKNIMCPTNLSLETNQALVYAVALARDFKAKLFVCYCAEDPLPAGGERVKETLSKMIEAQQTQPIEWEVIVTEGNIAESVTQAAYEHQIDLMVMYANRKPYTAALFGSNAESICRMAPCPILITHPSEQALVDPETKQTNIMRVLVAYDFSENSKYSLLYALTLANAYSCEIHILHVAKNPDDIEKLINELKEALPEPSDGAYKVRYTVITGKAHEEILKYAREHKIDLICVDTREASFSPSVFSTTNSLLFGSVTDKILRKSSCPILVVRPFVLEEKSQKTDSLKILVATDGSSYAEAAIDYAANWIWPTNSELRVITVIEPLSTLGPHTTHYQLASELLTASQKLVISAAEKLRKTKLTVSYHVRGGFAADEIITEAKEWEADVIIVGTHGRRGISRFLLGSVAENVAAHAPCSVTIVKHPNRQPIANVKTATKAKSMTTTGVLR